MLPVEPVVAIVLEVFAVAAQIVVVVAVALPQLGLIAFAALVA